MSIWSSVVQHQEVDVLDYIPERDTYTCEAKPGSPTYSIDVATATPWHDGIRLSLDGPDREVVLAPKEAQALIDRLTEALAHVAARR